MNNRFLFLFLSIFSSFSFAQSNTDIYLLEVEEKAEGYTINSATQITRNLGYDNQPYFSIEGNFLLYASAKPGYSQSDIYALDIRNWSLNAWTSTPNESEFSPNFMPDPKFYSVVKVEKDSSQRIWKIPVTFDGKTKPQVLFPLEKKVGYYAWITAEDVVAFMVGDPFTLYAMNTEKSAKTVIDKNIGRTILKVPGEKAVTYVRKNDDGWKIMKWDLETQKSTVVIRCLEGSEDFTWTSKGAILMGQDGILYRFNPKKDKDWVKVADLTTKGLKNFYRLAINSAGNKIAVVTEVK
jgi:Tol biopolymer transport system component